MKVYLALPIHRKFALPAAFGDVTVEANFRSPAKESVIALALAWVRVLDWPLKKVWLTWKKPVRATIRTSAKTAVAIRSSIIVNPATNLVTGGVNPAFSEASGWVKPLDFFGFFGRFRLFMPIIALTLVYLSIAILTSL